MEVKDFNTCIYNDPDPVLEDKIDSLFALPAYKLLGKQDGVVSSKHHLQ